MFGTGQKVLLRLAWSKFWPIRAKGQTISEWIYEVIVSPKNEQKIVKISALYCATLQVRNPYNFLGETMTS